MKLSTKLFSIVMCGMALSLSACGNSKKSSFAKPETVTSSKVSESESHHSNTSKNSQKELSLSNSSLSQTKNSIAGTSDTAKFSSKNNNIVGASSIKYNDFSASKNKIETDKSNVTRRQSVPQKQVTMTATDAKNIVKEHIGNQLNNRGISGQSTNDLPSIDSIDDYTATQNGTNNWTISGNGHSFNVTTTAVTGN